MTSEKRERRNDDPHLNTLLNGCVWLILVAAGAAVFLVTLFVASWILT